HRIGVACPVCRHAVDLKRLPVVVVPSHWTADDCDGAENPVFVSCADAEPGSRDRPVMPMPSGDVFIGLGERYRDKMKAHRATECVEGELLRSAVNSPGCHQSGRSLPLPGGELKARKPHTEVEQWIAVMRSPEAICVDQRWRERQAQPSLSLPRTAPGRTRA